MSSQVRYLVGNTPYRDCQYWPTITHADLVAKLISEGQTPGDAETYVTSLEYFPLDQKMIMALAWRVREWTVSGGNFSFSGVNPFATGDQNWSMEGEWDEFIVKTYRIDPATDYLPITDESQILGPSSEFQSTALDDWPTLRNAGMRASSFVTGTLTEIDPGIPAAGIIIFNCFTLNNNVGFTIYDPISKLFHPNFLLGAGCAGGSNGASVQIGFVDSPGGATNDGVPAGSFTLVGANGGASLTKTSKIRGVHTGNPNNEGSGSVSDVTMTATKWWPYKNSAGSPVYDVNSGGQLANPFS